MARGRQPRKRGEGAGRARSEQASARDEVLAAAALMFMERGYAATSLDDIAARLGATKGRIYHYWNSKIELFVEIHTAAMERIAAAVAPIAARDHPADDKLYSMALEHVRVLIRDFPVQKVAVQGLERHLLHGGPPARAKMMRRLVVLRDEYEELFARVIADGVAAGLFRSDLPPRLATKPFFGALNWLTIWFEPAKASGEEEQIAEALARFAVAGLAASPRPPG
jgi:AcrR family transcriptional regulator